MTSDIPSSEKQAAMKQLRAAAHMVVAAGNRYEAELLRALPIGTPVKVYGSWKGQVARYVLPLDGTVSVAPDQGEEIGKYATPDRYGNVMVHVDNVNLIG